MNSEQTVVEQAQLYIDQGQPQLAERTLRVFVDTNDNSAFAFQKLGVAVAMQNKRTEAIDFFKKAINLNPKLAMAYNGLGLALTEQGDYKEAENYCLHGIEVDDSYIRLYSTYAFLLKLQGKLELAEGVLKRALQVDPKQVSILKNLATILASQGKKEEAVICLQNALEVEPSKIELYDYICELKEFQSAQDPFIEQMEHLLLSNKLNGRNESHINFALATAYEKLRDYKKAYYYYEQANALVRSVVPYNHDSTLSFFKVLKSVLNEQFAQRFRHLGVSNEETIFVLGMPRSGTSLVEQILASHSQVFGAGELDSLGNFLYQSLGSDLSQYPHALRAISEGNLVDIQTKYLNVIKQTSKNKEKFIVDKMPHNFRFIGLILTLFPNAKIIHCTRERNDVILSNFKCNFNADLPYAFDLKDIVKFYRAYEDLMQHWNKLYPDQIYALEYKNLIKNQEEETRSLLDYCGLEWEQSCIDFHKTKRSVTTASAGQVQQPLYSSALEYWKNFEPYMPKDIFIVGK